MDELFLAHDFSPASEADWLKLIEKGTGGQASSLWSALYENLSVKPLYTKDQSASWFAGAGKGRGWQVIQALEADSTLAADVAGGLDALKVDVEDLSLPSLTQLKKLLAPLHAEPATPLAFYGSGLSSLVGAALLAAASPSALKGNAGLDPITNIILSGEIPADRAALYADAIDAAHYLQSHHPEFTPFLASDQAWHLAGGSAVEEIGFTLAAACGYWRALHENGGFALDAAAKLIGFSLTANADLFLTIAKFRATRLVWARALEVAEVSGGANTVLIAEMSPRIMSERDAHNNLLRGTAALFGAALGGADAIHVLPFNKLTANTPEDRTLSRRLARNTSHILRHESGLAAVADPAHGSWYVESLTAALAEKAWSLFTETEAMGGLVTALETGFVNARLYPIRSARETAIARMKDKITGVSSFPNLSEIVPLTPDTEEASSPDLPPFLMHAPVLKLPAADKGERFGRLVEAAQSGKSISDLNRSVRLITEQVSDPLILGERLSQPFEILRRQSDLALEALGSRPPVFVARVGDISDHRARVLWLYNFFSMGGVEAVIPEQSFSTLEALLASFQQNPSPIACLCGANPAYGTLPGAAAALKSAGALLVYVAGPASVLQQLSPDDAAAVDRLLYQGCDALHVLEELHAVLRVEDLSSEEDEEAMDR